MTQRTEHKPTAVETAVDAVILSVLPAAITAYAKHQPPMPEKNFRELVAHVLENMSANDWRRRLNLEPQPEHDEHR